MSVETAARLCEGGVMPDFTIDTPFAAGLSLSETVQKTPKTALLFLRYYGCTLCQYEMHLLAENYDQITAAGGQVLVVLQSDPAGIAEQIGPDSLPFTIGIQPAASMAKMADAGTMLKIAKATAVGYKHGAYEGNELQLPASFVVDKERRISYAHYGKSAGDTPDVRSLAELLK